MNNLIIIKGKKKEVLEELNKLKIKWGNITLSELNNKEAININCNEVKDR